MTGRRSDSSWCAPPRPMNCRCAPSAISSACNSGWSDSSCCRWCCPAWRWTAWRGYRRGDAGGHPAVDRGDRSVRLFLLEIADACGSAIPGRCSCGRPDLPPPPSTSRCCRGKAFRHRMIRSTMSLGRRRDRLPASSSSCWSFLYYVVSPWNFIGRIDPIGGEAGYRAGRGPGAGRTAKDRRDLDRHHRTTGPMRCCAGTSTAACR